MFSAHPSINRKYLDLFLVALVNKLNGNKVNAPLKKHFDKVVCQAKSVHEDPIKANKNTIPQAYYLSSCMCDHEDLKQAILEIDSIDDVDEKMSNRILMCLEPLYARAN